MGRLAPQADEVVDAAEHAIESTTKLLELPQLGVFWVSVQAGEAVQDEGSGSGDVQAVAFAHQIMRT